MSQPNLAAIEAEFKQRQVLARLKAKLKARGITQDRVAEQAGVGRTLVAHVLAGRAKSQNVVDTVKRLLAEAPAIVAAPALADAGRR